MTEITLTCERCNEEFTYERLEKRGRPRQFCDNCTKSNVSLVRDSLLRDGDHSMLEFIQKHLGVNRPEAVRTAIRVYYAILKQNNRT